jgi:hypothetical protein
MSVEDVETSKRREAERRNITRKSNREAHASFAKEIKESLVGGGRRMGRAKWRDMSREVATARCC